MHNGRWRLKRKEHAKVLPGWPSPSPSALPRSGCLSGPCHIIVLSLAVTQPVPFFTSSLSTKIEPFLSLPVTRMVCPRTRRCQQHKKSPIRRHHRSRPSHLQAGRAALFHVQVVVADLRVIGQIAGRIHERLRPNLILFGAADRSRAESSAHSANIRTILTDGSSPRCQSARFYIA
jgi:hypothetical protein